MLKKLLIPVLLMLSIGTVSAGEMTLLEEAAEFETLSARVSDKGRGNLRIKNCDQCDELKLKIAPTTKLTVRGKVMPLTTLNKHTLQSGTVFYLADSRIVTRIKASR